MSEEVVNEAQSDTPSENFQESFGADDNAQGSNDLGETNERPEFDLVLGIGVDVSVEMGCKSIKLKDLLKLGKNSVIELDKMAGDPLDIKANGALIARGEVVIVNGRYGIRLSEVVSRSERIKNIDNG